MGQHLSLCFISFFDRPVCRRVLVCFVSFASLFLSLFVVFSFHLCCSKFFFVGMMNNNMTLFSCAHVTFISLQLFLSLPTAAYKKTGNKMEHSTARVEHFSLISNPRTLLVTKLEPSNESCGLRLTSGSTALNPTAVFYHVFNSPGLKSNGTLPKCNKVATLELGFDFLEREIITKLNGSGYHMNILFGPTLVDDLIIMFDICHYSLHSDYCLHLHCYIHNVSADASFGFLQVILVKL